MKVQSEFFFQQVAPCVCRRRRSCSSCALLDEMHAVARSLSGRQWFRFNPGLDQMEDDTPGLEQTKSVLDSNMFKQLKEELIGGLQETVATQFNKLERGLSQMFDMHDKSIKQDLNRHETQIRDLQMRVDELANGSARNQIQVVRLQKAPDLAAVFAARQIAMDRVKKTMYRLYL